MATPAQRVLVLTLVTGLSGAVYLVLPDSPLACVPLGALGLATWWFGRSVGFLLAGILSAAPLGVSAPAAASLSCPLILRALLFGGATWGFARARRAYHELTFQAERDLLTGLQNRRGLEKAARRELGSARRGQRPLSVAFLDLDDFKHVNDVLGHAEGDRLLATIGAALARGRRSDVVARLGGDEFVVLMPDTDDMAARAAIERLRHTTAAAIERAGFQVTFTTGLATFESPPGSLATVLREVDRLLYEGKRWRKDSVSSKTVAADATPAVTLRITRPRTRFARG